MYTMTYPSIGSQEDLDYPKLTVKSFSGDVLDTSEDFIKDLLEDFQLQCSQYGAEKYSLGEYVYGLLMLGTLWRIYYNKITPPTGKPKKILSKLFAHNQQKETSPPNVPLKYNRQNLEKLFQWLESNGEFKPELKQLLIWKEFLGKQKSHKLNEYLRSIIIFADWFKTSSKYLLGNYTRSEKRFLYYLRLMGSEISNRTTDDKPT